MTTKLNTLNNPKTANKAGSVTTERVLKYNRWGQISHVEVVTTVVKPDGTIIAKIFVEK